MSQDIKTEEPKVKEGEGFLRRLLDRIDPSAGDAHSGSAGKSTLDLDDIQGIILRGYRMPMVRHFLLSVGVPAAARKMLGRLVSGDEADAPQITTAEEWQVGLAPGPGDNPAEAPCHKPDYCLNLGITWPGLIALEIKDRVPTLSFKSFNSFMAGAAERAAFVGDTGASAPQNWVGGFGKGSDHVLVTLYAISPEAMTSYSERLSALFSEDDAFREIWRADGMALTEVIDGKPTFTSRLHFGYTDGISMTTIRGGPLKYKPDHQQPCEPWLFVLQDGAENYTVPEPRELGLNGSFSVFKMIVTDVVGFENNLQKNKDKIDPELLAAKMCGRWRNGVPLALSPETDSPAGGISPDQLNSFGYVNSRWLRGSKGASLSRWGAYTPRKSSRPASRRTRRTWREQQCSPNDPSWYAIRASL